MYLEHFGLSRPPFKITPDTSLFYEGSQRGAALGALMFAIRSGEGIIKVVGEVGSGKTMICRMLEVKLADEVDIVYIANPSLSPDNILHVIAHELELDITNDASKLEVMQQLQGYLLKKHADNRQVVMFVEEAQSMPVETLEEIRLLSNLETDQNKLLQMVLFGQPELDEKLSQNHIRQLKERITHSFYLEPFLPKDTFEYLNFRMREVGYRGPDIFNHKTAGSVKKYSNGLTRRINILADKSLMASFSEGKHAVAVKHVKIAARDSDFETIGNNRKILIGALMVASLILAVWFGTLLPGLKKPLLDSYSNAAIQQNGSINAAKVLNVVNNSAVDNIELAQPVKLDIENRQKPVIKEESVVAIQAEAVVVSEESSVEQAVSTSSDTVLALVAGPGIETTGGKEPDGAGSVVEKEAQIGEKMEFDSLVENRLYATGQWVSSVRTKNYSIQLFLASNSGLVALEEFLANVPESLDFNKIYIYETLINNVRMYSVNYDDYTSFSMAVKTLHGLTDDFQASKPFIRRISDFHNVIRNNLVSR